MADYCVFCQIILGKIPGDFLYENDNFVAFPDAEPKVDGHTLIIPKKHFVNSMDMPSSLGMEFFDAVKAVAEKKFKQGFEGFNLIQNNFDAAGQIVEHFHVHFLPRRKNDGFKIDV